MNRSFRNRATGLIAVAALSFTTLASCTTVPITGRSQLNIVPASSMQSMSVAEYENFKKSTPRGRDARESERVRRVGGRLRAAVEQYMRSNGMSAELNGYSWEYNLFENKEANAWAMPGGKIAVYTGILPFTNNDAGLAVVMSHEIAHVIARHGSERMSQALISEMGGLALGAALSSKPEETRQLWGAVYGLGSSVGILMPYSRLQESEADRLGLIFMAMAGYDPHEAVPFWQRMAAKEGSRPPELLSTHPAPVTRIRNIQAAIPEAMRYYSR